MGFEPLIRKDDSILGLVENETRQQSAAGRLFFSWNFFPAILKVNTIF